jgi:hypothetical protein
MSALLISMCIYLLGFIGLTAIGILPLRSWQVLRNAFKNNAQQKQKKMLVAFAVIMTVSSLWIDVLIALRIFRCLTETYCGPGVASGWAYLAMLGVVYLFFEALSFLFRNFFRTTASRA